MIGSVHIEVDDVMTADRLDALQRDITQAIIGQYHVILAGIGVYSRNTRDDRAAEILNNVRRVAMSRDYVLQLHGFYIDAAAKVIRFDVIVDYAAPSAEAVRSEIAREVEALYPDYEVHVTLDVDISD